MIGLNNSPSANNKGRVEIYIDEQKKWGAFCAGKDSFSDKTADVACKQMGYDSGAILGGGDNGACDEGGENYCAEKGEDIKK